MGQTVGTETVTLTTPQMPAHNHLVNADTAAATAQQPIGGNLASSQTPPPSKVQPGDPVNTYTTGTPTGATTLAPSTIQQQGGNQSHPNLQPSLCINYCIAIQGIFPPRS